MYLAGDLIECTLKTRLMRQLGCRHLDELGEKLFRRGSISDPRAVYTHEFALLMKWSGRLEVIQCDKSIARLFSKVNRWSPTWRYNAHVASRESAEDYLAAIDEFHSWIQANI